MTAPTTPPRGLDLDEVLAIDDEVTPSATAREVDVQQWLQQLRGLAEQHQLPPLIVPPVWIRNRFELHPWELRRDMTTLAAWCEVLDDSAAVEVWRLWQPSGYDPYPGHPDATTGGGVIGVHGQLLGEPVVLLADSWRIPPAPADLDLDVIRELAAAEQRGDDVYRAPEPEPEPARAAAPEQRRMPSPVPVRSGPTTPGQLFVKGDPTSGNVPPSASEQPDVITSAPSATPDTNGGS